jgi:PAS domain S-box-containing protein
MNSASDRGQAHDRSPNGAPSRAGPSTGPTQDAFKLQAILNSAVDAIILIDSKGIIETLNPATQELFGYASDELVGQNVRILMPEPDRSRHDGYLRHYLDTGERRIIGIGREVVGRCKDGSVFPMRLSVGEYVADGQRYFTGIIHDLSAKKAAELALGRQRNLFKAIFDHVPDPLFISNAESGTLLMCNPAFARVFGYDCEEVVGRSERILYGSDAEHSRVERLRQKLRGEGGAEVYVVTCRRKDGTAFKVQGVATVVHDPAGEVIGVLQVVRDISEELKQEEALRKSQRMEVIGQLTGGIAHDFNNLLTVITGNLELHDSQLEEGAEREFLKRAHEAADMGARLTNRLLTFARRRKLEPVVVSLNDQVLSMIELLRRTLGENINLRTRLGPDLGAIKVDPSEIENAIMNLALNARDAMPGGGNLAISTQNSTIDETAAASEPGLTPGEYVKLSVSDTGAGMSAEVMQRIFEPFFTTKEPGKGTGLGLSVVYGFVKASGGHVTVYSEVGQGTTFNIYLPKAETGVSAGAGSSTAKTLPQGNGELVLVVEDNPQVRILTVSRLQRLGYTVQEAENGPSALNVLGSGAKFDLVFSDVVMPGGMSGFELARWVETNAPGVRVLLSSGFADAAAHDAGSNYDLKLLHKPYNMAELAHRLREALDA